MAEVRSSKRTSYQEDMNIYRKIAEATGDSIEAICQMQEKERNHLIQVLGIQRETGATKASDEEQNLPGPSKGGRKRKALQTFLDENPNKKLNREGEERLSLRSSSRAAARKAKLKVSEINEILDNDPDQNIEDFDDLDLVGNAPEGKVEVEAITKAPEDDSDRHEDAGTARSNFRTKCPDLMKFVRKPEDILRGDLPEFDLNKERRSKFGEKEGEGERHMKAVKMLTSYGLFHGQLDRKSWIKIKIVKNKTKTIHVTKDGTLEGRASEDDEEDGRLNVVKDDQKKLNTQKENKNLFDDLDEDEPIVPSKFVLKARKGRGKLQLSKKSDDFDDDEDFQPPSASRKSLFNKIKSKGKKILKGGKGGFDFVDGDDEDDDEQLSLFDQVKQGKKTQTGGNNIKEKQPVDVENQSSAKSSDDEIQIVKEVQSPHNSQVPRRASIFEDKKNESTPGKGKTACPICGIAFPHNEVEEHAATCGAL